MSPVSDESGAVRALEPSSVFESPTNRFRSTITEPRQKLTAPLTFVDLVWHRLEQALPVRQSSKYLTR